MKSRNLLFDISTILISVAGPLAFQAHAAAPAALEEIIVTAERREASVQDYTLGHHRD